MKSEMKKEYLVIYALIAIFILVGCEQVPNPSSGRDYGLISPMLSPDNKSIILVLYRKGSTELAMYGIDTGEMTRFNPTGNLKNLAPAYSRNGANIAFASGSNDDSNIFIINSLMSGLRQLTHNYNNTPTQRNSKGDAKIIVNSRPSFSPDGKKIIFVRSEIKRKRAMGGAMLSHWDIWEIDKETGSERRLTNYKFYRIGRPYYLKRGDQFIFSGDGAKPASGNDFENAREYEAIYKNNTIFIMDGRNNHLKPVLIHGWFSYDPTVSDAGDIVFIAESSKMEGKRGTYVYDLFIKKKNGVKKLTNGQFEHIVEPYISWDGKHIVFLGNSEKGAGPSLWLMKGDGTDLKKLNLPAWDDIKTVTVKND